MKTDAQLAAQKRDLLKKLRQNKTAAASSPTAIAPLAADGPVPLSFAQRRLWFLEQFAPGAGANHLHVVYRLQGSLCIEALEQSLTELTRRHSALRTVFPTEGLEPVQSIQPVTALTVPVLELEDGADWQDAVLQAADRPFDLTHGPLYRTLLLRVHEQEHIFLFTLHHILTDGWSNQILIQELKALYDAFSHNQPSPLPPVALSYADVAAWQQKRFAEGAFQKEIHFWLEQMSGATALLQLPLDRPRPQVITYDGAAHAFTLPSDAWEAVRAFCRREGVTPVMALLTVFQTLLHRYSGQTDISVGMPCLGRPRKETELVVGYFANTLVIRTELEQGQSFRRLLGRVRETSLAASEHQELPFEKLVEELQPERDTSYTPLFQVLFNPGAGHVQGEEHWGELTVTPLTLPSTKAAFDLTLEAVELADGMHFSFQYRTDLFDASTIRRMAGHYLRLLDACLADPDAAIERLALLSAEERDQLLIDWNRTAAPLPETGLLHRQFEEQAARTPHATALVADDATLTFAELDAKANRVAHALQARGVGPDVLVGIAMERRADLIVGLLGILKAGGAYVPVDPHYPKERIKGILEDAQVPVLLTQQDCLAQLPELTADVLCLDRDSAVIAEYPADAPHSSVRPEHLAYAIYTSGSTGKPKGVLVEHRNVVNFLLGVDQHLQPEANDALLAITSICFDISVLELFWSLTRGVQVVLLPSSSPVELERFLLEEGGQHRITLLQGTPSSLQLLGDDAFLALQSLRALLLGGEALPVALAEDVRRKLPARLLNMYGPTEATVWATVHEVGETEHTVPIGRPMTNVETYILDAAMQPVPAGIPGELYIGGHGVVRGYHRRDDLTAERFLPHPFAAEQEQRLYRTGDLARYLADGTIEYLGRLDDQVKLRGFRIELGEIESALTAHPDVAQAVVIAKTFGAGDTRLIAYYTKEAGAVTDPIDMSFLEHTLPEFMVPRVFVPLAEMPLTPNGKINRNALPEPVLNETAAAPTVKVAPKNETERVVAEIWQEVLGLTEISTAAQFFELGGHSLLAAQVRLKLQDRIGVQLTMVDLFRSTTVQTLAALIDSKKNRPQQAAPKAPVNKGMQDRIARQRNAMKNNKGRR